MLMKEKIARAIHGDGAGMPFEEIKWVRLDQADAVLDVLAEPDEGMVEAGQSMWVEADWDHWEDKARFMPDRPADDDGPFAPGLQSVWQAMIAAARNPQGGEG